MNTELGVDMSRYERFALDLDKNVMDFVLVDVYCGDEEIAHLEWRELVKLAIERDEQAAYELRQQCEEEEIDG
jgi:hypothetical protein